MRAAGKDLPFLRLAAWPLLLTAGAQYGLFRFLQRINYFLLYVALGGRNLSPSLMVSSCISSDQSTCSGAEDVAPGPFPRTLCFVL